MSNRTVGLRGETAAGEYLLRRGCIVLERNFRTRYGEIDLIALDGDTVVFAEVKTRRSRRAGTGREAVTPRKRQRIVRTALEYLQLREMEGKNVRFDVIEIEETPQGRRLAYIPAAFDGEGY